MRLNDPADVVCVGAVSRLWCQFGIEISNSCTSDCIGNAATYSSTDDDDPDESICVPYIFFVHLRSFSPHPKKLEERISSFVSRKVLQGSCMDFMKTAIRLLRHSNVQLNLRKFPRLSRIARITKPDLRVAKGKDVESSNSSWETLRRDHNVYASLLQAIETSNSCPSDCIANAVRASSTDRFPDESIINTLAPRDRYQDLPPYWSSTGHSDPNAHETLIYKLKADLCVITEINIQPFEVCFHPGKPICSAKSVRFRVGHLKSSSAKSDLLHFPQEQPADDMFIWEYVSEEFPMRQVELLGIAQICDMDNLFYICIRHVKVRARLLSPAFGVQNVEPSGDFVLKYKRGSLI